ncbi:MAG TPA: ABC transporter permease [Gemmatimonadaceae bacterium]|nr:ABC transporter permease [Gemmatimonadaceae bacterium]
MPTTSTEELFATPARSLPPVDPAGAAAGPWRGAVRRLRRDRSAMVGLAALAALALAAVFAPLVAPYDPIDQPDIIGLKSLPPSLAHPFGTDQASRDVLSRVIYGARVSLGVAALSMLVAITMGTIYGAVAGYRGGRTDAAMMRAVDTLLSIPRILLLIAVLSLWTRTPILALVLLIGFTGWFGVSRIVRAQVLSLKEREFVVAARALGASGPRLLVRHILPNVASPIVVAATLGVGHVIILEAGLSYLGLGVQPPQASWGSIIRDGSEQVTTLWWISLFPGLAIVLTVMALNALGDGMRDALDVRGR